MSHANGEDPVQWNAIISRVGLIASSAMLWLSISSHANPLTLVPLFAIVSFAFGGLITLGQGRAAKPEKLQYSIGDMYVLIVYLALLALPLFPLLGLPIAIMTALFIASWWWLGLRLLSRNRITRASSRLTVLAFSIPLAYGVAPFLLGLGFCGLPFFKAALAWKVPSYFYPFNYILLTLLLGIWLSFLCISISASRASLRSVLQDSQEK
jgi:hypothetical protein